MPLIMEPIAEAEARADGTVRWTWTEGPYPGPYDPDQFILAREGTGYRGKRMVVDAGQLAITFPIQPQAGDEFAVPGSQIISV